MQDGYGVVVTNTNQNEALVEIKGKKVFKSIKVECKIAGETNQFRWNWLGGDCIKQVHHSDWFIFLLKTARNTTDVMQVVNFTDLMQVYHQVTSSLLTLSSYIISVKIRLDPTWYLQTCCKLLKQYASSLWIKSLDNQLALSQLTNCSRLVIIKSEQAMWTHPDIQTCCNLDVPGCVAIVINITFLYKHPLKYNLIATLTCEVIPISPIQIMVYNNIFTRLCRAVL